MHLLLTVELTLLSLVNPATPESTLWQAHRGLSHTSLIVAVCPHISSNAGDNSTQSGASYPLWGLHVSPR